MDIKYEVTISAYGYNILHFRFDKATSAADFARMALTSIVDKKPHVAIVLIRPDEEIDEEASE